MRSENNNLLKGYNMLLYFAGSMIINEPSEECISDFWSEGSLKKLPVKSDNPRFLQASLLLRESESCRDSFRNNLSRDHKLLFSMKSLSLAPPNESSYHTPHDKVTEFYDSYGWNYRALNDMEDDHIGTELLFLTKMIDKYLQLDDAPCRSAMKSEIRRYIDGHLLSWIPAWNFNIQENAITKSYKGIGNLIHACTEDIYGILS
jgi:TorA maturation chaperone TorD